MADTYKVTNEKYGEDRSQFMKIFTPMSPSDKLRPFAAIVHGGFWREEYGIDPPTACCETLAPYFASAGYIAAEIEYRRKGSENWGWPHSNNDVLAAYEKCLTMDGIDKDKILVVGHSVGATMALYLAAELEEAGPRATVALAPIASLQKGVELQLSDDGHAIADYMHGLPSQRSHDYGKACPTRRIRDFCNLRMLCVAGTCDEDVPSSMIEEFASSLKSIASKSALVDFINIPGANHYDLANANSIAWNTVVLHLNLLL